MYSCLVKPGTLRVFNRGRPGNRTEVIKIIAFLELKPRLNIKYKFNWAGKNWYFSKLSLFENFIHRSSKSDVFQ
ncbi:MAG: hypothetical protein DRH24_19310 [Deltaproteobacteria bacterium]|nr:MAG: hypothetical protein DRH24_19310 [Deltaproteobacteria bacterium]